MFLEFLVSAFNGEAGAEFVLQLLAMVAPIGFTVSEQAARQPKGRHDSRETELVGLNEPFLSPEQQAQLKGWWLKHKVGAKLPTWDLAVSALDAQKRKSLILVEAKAHATELSAAGKSSPKRKKPMSRNGQMKIISALRRLLVAPLRRANRRARRGSCAAAALAKVSYWRSSQFLLPASTIFEVVLLRVSVARYSSSPLIADKPG
jgi:hypothetical protein